MKGYPHPSFLDQNPGKNLEGNIHYRHSLKGNLLIKLHTGKYLEGIRQILW